MKQKSLHIQEFLAPHKPPKAPSPQENNSMKADTEAFWRGNCGGRQEN
jgi:hypothetical protein